LARIEIKIQEPILFCAAPTTLRGLDNKDFVYHASIMRVVVNSSPD